MQEIRVNLNQIHLQVRDYEQAGDAIIFLHFSGANLMMWQSIIPYFQDHYRVILVDLRGHGKSDQPETGYHMDEMASDVIGMMRQIKIERAHIVGSSLGAEVGLAMAANYPEKVISLVCDGAPCSEYGPYGTWEGSEADYEDHVARTLEKVRSAPEPVFPSIDALVENRRERIEKYTGWNEYIEAVERYGACKVGEGKYTRGFGKQAMENYLANYFRYRFEEYYCKVKCPLLMLTGDEEPGNEREMAVLKEMGKLAARAQIVEIHGWEHPYGWLFSPDDVSRAILKFLGDLVN